MKHAGTILLLLGLLLGGCYTAPPGSERYGQRHDSAPERRPTPAEMANPEPVAEPRSQYGNPETYTVRGRTYHVMDSAEGYAAEGRASWYGEKFHGHRTSSGEPYDMYQLSAAHKTLPLPTWARVTNLDNGKSTIVRVNDRGPFHPGRLIDLSWAAAVKLDIADNGTGRVRVEAITPGNGQEKPTTTAAKGTISEPVQARGLYLQVGAFSQKDHARDLVTRLIDRINNPVALRPGDNLFRVWVGPFDTSRERERVRQRLENSGFTELVAVNP